MSNFLGQMNKELSEENSKLQFQNDRLQEKIEELRLLLSKNGDGKIIPLNKEKNVSIIARLKVKISNLEKRLSKYEDISATDKFDTGYKKSSYTDIINKVPVREEPEEETKKTTKIELGTDDYHPQDSNKLDSALVKAPRSFRRRMSAKESFGIVREFLDKNGESSRLNISIGTELSEHQVERAVKKYGDKLNIRKDPNNRRRILYNIK